MSKTPPNRRGITFEVGAQLEARDNLKNWYAANIEKIDYEDEKVLIHYRQWSHRYDEWFDWASPYLRPVERIQLRREGLQDDCPIPGFHVNEKVLASWSDCRFYPAKVLAVNRDASYTVKFYDGVIQTVKGIHVKPFIRERKGGNSRTMDRHPVRKVPSGKDGKLLVRDEYGGAKNKRARRSMSDQEGESETEEDQEEEEAQDCRRAERGVTEDDKRVEPKKRTVEKRKSTREEPESTSAGLADGESDITGVRGGEGEGKDCVTETLVTNGSGERVRVKEEREDGKPEEEVRCEPKEEEEEERVDGGTAWQGEGAGEGEEVVTGKLRHQNRRTQGRISAGRWTENAEHGVLELRKRKISLGQAPSSKRCRNEANTDGSCSTEAKPATDTEPPGGVQIQGLGSSASVADVKEEQTTSGQTENLRPAGETGQPAPVRAPVVRRQADNPNRFSREPLYRVIKNQPPPVLFINLDHNPFKCQIPGCLKSFRKAKLLHYHMKYYHSGDPAGCHQGGDVPLSPTRSVHTRASEKQAPLESPKRRRTTSTSASLHSPPHGTHRNPQQSFRGEAKAAGGRLGDRRRTSAPPDVGTQIRHHRPSLREKSRENHLERTGRGLLDPGLERSAIESALAKEREKLKEKKRRDFLRIKLKKKKKKKKSKSELTGSEENVEISAFRLQSTISLLHKSPFSHKHSREPGHNTGLIHVDDEDSCSDWSSDSFGWSEDELDLGVASPLPERGFSAGTSSSEIIRCVCQVADENDFMVQCEECLCWQHGPCMGLLEENVPEKYTCYICRDPPGQRRSLRYWYDRDWLSSGHMYGLPFLEENYSHQNAKKMAATHQLLGDVQRVLEVLNGLQLKMSVLQSPGDPELQLWCQPWKPAEKGRKKGRAGAAPSPATDEGEEREREADSALSFQDSYISSEHCYQKPRAYYPAMEQRLVVELGDRLRSSQDLLALEQRYGDHADTDRGKILGPLVQDRPARAKGASGCRWQGPEPRQEPEQEQEDEEKFMELPGDEGSCLQQQWQVNLLDHIEAVQDEVTQRMDFIERELDVLESWLDYTGELEPPEPLARLPQLKHRIKQLLAELVKVQQIAYCCST